MKNVLYLIIAVVGNALGTAFMSETNLGMTAWGAGSLNFAKYFDLSLGTGFIILSVFFYLTATIIRRKFILIEMIQSFLFLFSFGFLTDFFIYFMPNLDNLNIFSRGVLNVFGMSILFFSIALHLRVYIAVHPMDVFLSVVQGKLRSVSKGTYLVYFIAFSVGVLFGLLNNGIVGFGFGTINTLLFSGVIMDFFDRKVVTKYFVKTQ